MARRIRGRMLPRWMETSFRDSSFSQHDAPSLGIFEYLNEACGLTRQTERVMALCRMAGNIGWVIPHRRVCWLVERHNVLETDDRKRLHNGKGPAIAFAEAGRSMLGRRAIPSWMIQRPQEITAGRIDRERDPIVRRCMIDIIDTRTLHPRGRCLLCLGGRHRHALDQELDRLGCLGRRAGAERHSRAGRHLQTIFPAGAAHRALRPPGRRLDLRSPPSTNTRR